MKTVAIILSGGEGRRFSNKLPKQFVLIEGKPILFYTIEKFHTMEEIDEIVIVSHRDFVDYVKWIVSTGEFSKVRCVIEGGKERKDSTYNALTILSEDDCEKVLIHDAVRPFVAKSVIRKCIATLDSHTACAVAVPATDTVFELDDEKIACIPNRKRMYLAQTPQGFHLSLIKKAYKKLMQETEAHFFSDDCGIFMHYLEKDVRIVEGNRENIKLTYPQDEMYLKEIFKEKLDEELREK